MSNLRPLLLRVRRQYLRHRRALAALLAAAAVVVAVQAAAPPPAATSPIVVASRLLPAGSVIADDDVRVVSYDPDLVPAAATTTVDEVVGRTVAGPLGAGEPVTLQRLLGETLLAGYGSGLVAAPVRIADAAAVALLNVGEHIDVYAADGNPAQPAPVVVSAAEVAALPPGDDDSSSVGALVVLVVPPEDAAALAQAAATTQLSIGLRG